MREALVLEARRKIAFTQEMYAREDERRARERTEIADSINRWAGHPEQTIRGAQASVVLIDETPLLQDVAVRRPWWKFWAR
ncbi:hypothetical protein M2390_002943 [Mycetocola sp. BIGb0189]|uniref:hypothetical protein n=1 Tax=Mycetocola sp. BIGb0189 TaxID=2940604 RepID=UPI00216A71DD|nr:hypothetical protein [Mycetocola sp. BIGb0189]MCS4277734.1 hypothetical protein [Mycetocola sp. BIGb0189]